VKYSTCLPIRTQSGLPFTVRKGCKWSPYHHRLVDKQVKFLASAVGKGCKQSERSELRARPLVAAQPRRLGVHKSRRVIAADERARAKLALLALLATLPDRGSLVARLRFPPLLTMFAFQKPSRVHFKALC
jgi:hypothetical protein